MSTPQEAWDAIHRPNEEQIEHLKLTRDELYDTLMLVIEWRHKWSKNIDVCALDDFPIKNDDAVLAPSEKQP